MRLLPLLALATACAATEAGPSGGAEAGLDRELAGRTAGEPRDCVPASPGANLVPRGKQAVVLDQGGTIWVSRLAAPCPGLDAWSTIVIDVHNGQYCRGDRFRTVAAGQSVAGPICVLGDFTPYRR